MTTANPERTRTRRFELPKLPPLRCARAWRTPSPPSRPVRPRTWFGALQGRARPAAHVVLPAGRRLRAAAHHRPDHGAEREQRVLLQAQRRRLLRRGPAPAAVGADRPAGGVRGQPAALPGRAPPRLPGLLDLAGAPAAHRVPRRPDQRQPELARPRPDPDPALGDRQARAGHLGRAHLRQQGAPPRQHPRDHRAGGARAWCWPSAWWSSATTSARRSCWSRCSSGCCGWSARRSGSSRSCSASPAWC